MNLRALLVFALLASCAPKRTIVVDGKEVPYAEAARSEFALAKKTFDAGKNEEAAAQLKQFVAQFADSEWVEEALLHEGQALSRAGKPAEAQAPLQELLEKHPTSRWKGTAALELGLVQAKLGKKEAAAQSIKQGVGEMSEKEKAESAGALAQTYAQSGQAGEGLRWAAKALEGASEADKEARTKDYVTALEQAPAGDVAKLVAELDRSSAAWPPAAVKLARIQLHTGDRAHAGELAGEVLGRVQGGPWADAARLVQRDAGATGNVKPQLVGIVLPLTDDKLKSFADLVLNAVALSINLENKGPLQVEVKDSHGDPDAAAQAVEDLARDGVIAILGPIGVSEGPAAAVRAQQLGVPMISLSRNEGLTQLGEYIFRDMPPLSAQAKALADYATKKLGARTFGILRPDSTYGDDMSRSFWDEVDALGGEVRAIEHYPQETTTFKPFIQRMVGRAPSMLAERKEFSEEEAKIAEEITDPYRRRKALSQLKSQAAPVVDFDALFIPDGARKVRLIAPSVAAEDVITSGCDAKELEVVKKTTRRDDLRSVQLLGTSLWDAQELVDERMGAARYVQCSIFADTFFAQSDRPATRKFVEEYDAAYHRAPGWLEAHAHDAAAILRRTLEEKKPQTRAELRDALATLQKPYDGAAGETRFDKDREAQKPFFWLWINRGNIQEFDPEGPPPVPPAVPPSAPGTEPAVPEKVAPPPKPASKPARPAKKSAR